MRRLLEYLGDACILAFGIFSMVMLVRIAGHGKMILYEPNPAILALEIVVCFIIIILALERTVDDTLGLTKTSVIPWKKIKDYLKKVFGYEK